MWLEKEENTELKTPKSRAFLVEVKNALLKKGLRMDYGYRDIGLIAMVTEADGPQGEKDRRRIATLPEADGGQSEKRISGIQYDEDAREPPVMRVDQYYNGKHNPKSFSGIHGG